MQHQPGWWVIMSYLFTLSPGTFRWSDVWSPDRSHSRNLDAGAPGRAIAPLLSWGAPVRLQRPREGVGSHHRRGWRRENISPIPGDLITLSVKGGNLGNFKFHVMWETIFWIRVMMILFNRQSHLSFCWRLQFFQSSTRTKKILFFLRMYIFLILIWGDNYPAIMFHKMWHLTHLSQLIKIFQAFC